MITVNSEGRALSAAFAEAVAQPLVDYDLQLWRGSSRLQCEVMSLALDMGDTADASDTSSSVPLGAVCMSSLDAVLADCGTVLVGDVLDVRVGVMAGGAYEHVTVARVAVTYVSTNAAGVVSVQGVGAPSTSLGNALGLAAGSYTATVLRGAIASASGLSVSILPGFASTSQNVWVDEGATCMDALSALALWLGGYAVDMPDGSVAVTPLPTTAALQVPTDSMTQHPQLSDGDYDIDGLTVTVPSEEGDPTVYEYGTGRVSVEDEHATQAMASTLWGNLRGKSYAPGTVTVAVLDPRVTVADAVSVESAGAVRTLPVMGVSAAYDGGWHGSMSAAGQSETAEAALSRRSVTERVDESLKGAARAVAYATDALGSAQTARDAAEAAVADAAEAKDAADSAQESADAAQADATRANTYSNAALDQLGVVQDVAGILTWASEQGAFVRTSDTAIVDGKVYFAYDSATGDYTPVVEPDVAQLPTYYELDMSGSKQAMNEYILAHLAVTSRGLWVLPAGKGSAVDEQHAAGYKMLLASDGCYIYDGSGVLVRSDTASGTDFAEGRSFHFGSDDAYILYTPAHGSTPAQITIGGANVVLGESRTLSELLAEVDNDLDFKVDDSYSQDGLEVTLTAHVYKGGVDVAPLHPELYPDSCFAWYRKNESGYPQTPMGNGRTITLQRSVAGYGAAIKCVYTPVNDAGLLTGDDDTLTDAEGTPYTARTPSGDYVRVADLTVETTVFDTDKVMVVGSEDEHLVSIATLKETFGDGDYERLSNKPSIEGVTLSGNKDFPDLGIFQMDSQGYSVPDEYTLTTMDINALWANAAPIGA